MTMTQVGGITLLYARDAGLPRGRNMVFGVRRASKSLLGSLSQDVAPQNLSKLVGKVGIIMISFTGLL